MQDLSMMTDASPLAALLAALLGAGHCVGMCGTLLGAMTLGVAPGRSRWPLLLAYNLGRLSSYALAGLLAGWLGSLALGLSGLRQTQGMLLLVSGVMMLLTGVYLGGWWSGMRALERLGAPLWRRLEPYARRALPVRDVQGALLLGALWGWLPCGLVYGVLLWALAAADPWYGLLLMLAFGIGTLPVMLTVGGLAAQMAALLRQTWLRQTAACLVLGLGGWFVLRAVRVLG